jgi:ABC-type cobalamin/Fe3+-siderophores transport system ATPase subunit
MVTMTVQIQVTNITFSYGDRSGAVFRDVSLSVGRGDIYCILGPNGTGKSTLLKCLCGVLRVQRGKILVEGDDLTELSPSETARSIGFVPQGLASAFPFIVKDIVVMGRAPHLSLLASPTREDRRIAYSAMERSGVLRLAERPCNGISGGEWQLVLIARALAQESKILLLDEPTSHLDLGNQVRILEVIRELASGGITILMATHFPDHALMVANRTAILNNGSITHEGPPDKVITSENMRVAYGTEVRVLEIGESVDRKACFPVLP